jgi:MFS family permease
MQPGVPVWHVRHRSKPVEPDATYSTLARRRPLPPLSRSRSGFLTLGGFVCILAGGVETTALPLFVSRAIHASTLDVGIVVGALTFSSMLARPFASHITSVAGTPGTLLATSFVAAAVLASYPWVHSVALLVVLRGVEGVADAGFLVSGIAAACEIAPEGRESQATGLFTSTTSLSLVGGSLIAGLLLMPGWYRTLWYSAASLAVVGGSITAAASRHGRPITVRPSAHLRFLHPAAVRPGATMALGVLPVGGFFALAPLYAERVGIAPTVVMGLFGGVIFTVRTAGSRISGRISEHQGTALAFGSTGVGVAIIGAVPPPVGLLTGTIVLAVGVSLCMPASLKLALEFVKPTEKVEVIGSMTAFFAAAQTAGAPLLGVVAGASSFRVAFSAGSCAPLAALVLQRSFNDRVKSQRTL